MIRIGNVIINIDHVMYVAQHNTTIAITYDNGYVVEYKFATLDEANYAMELFDDSENYLTTETLVDLEPTEKC